MVLNYFFLFLREVSTFCRLYVNVINLNFIDSKELNLNLFALSSLFSLIYSEEKMGLKDISEDISMIPIVSQDNAAQY